MKRRRTQYLCCCSILQWWLDFSIQVAHAISIHRKLVLWIATAQLHVIFSSIITRKTLLETKITDLASRNVSLLTRCCILVPYNNGNDTYRISGTTSKGSTYNLIHQSRVVNRFEQKNMCQETQIQTVRSIIIQ